MSSSDVPAMAAVKPCCFIARLNELEPVHEKRIKAWAGQRCREYRLLPPVSGVTTVCGILITPIVQKKFHCLWITLLKNWKVPPGAPHLPGKLRLVTLEEYRLELGTSPRVTKVCADIVGSIFDNAWNSICRKDEWERQNRATHAAFEVGQKRRRDEEAEYYAYQAKLRKEEVFRADRGRLGDDYLGQFRVEPVEPPFHSLAPRTELWWCSDAELELDSWTDVLQQREKARQDLLQQQEDWDEKEAGVQDMQLEFD
jgi:hypothetical protein